MMSMLDLHRLHVFLEVARAGSLSGAAAVLELSQPSVSHHVSRLEEEVGARLFVRHAGGISLTEIGELLQAHASVIVGRVATTEEVLRHAVGVQSRRVRLLAFPIAFHDLVPAAIARVRKQQPELEITAGEVATEAAAAAVRHAEADIAVAFDYIDLRRPAPLVQPRELDETELLRDRMLAVMPRQHPLAMARSVSLAEVAANGCVVATADEPLAELLLAASAEAGVTPQLQRSDDDHVVRQGLVAAGLALTVVPAMGFVAAGSPAVARRPIADQVRRRVYALTRAEGASPPTIDLLAELRSVARELAPS
jgi:DNA-binding transcriptional LysR family regulator